MTLFLTTKFKLILQITKSSKREIKKERERQELWKDTNWLHIILPVTRKKTFYSTTICLYRERCQFDTAMLFLISYILTLPAIQINKDCSWLHFTLLGESKVAPYISTNYLEWNISFRSLFNATKIRLHAKNH